MTNKRRTAIGLSGAVALLAMGAIVGAQGPGPHGGFRGRGPGGPEGPGGGAGFIPPIPNAPFSGTEVRSFSETLTGGVEETATQKDRTFVIHGAPPSN